MPSRNSAFPVSRIPSPPPGAGKRKPGGLVSGGSSVVFRRVVDMAIIAVDRCVSLAQRWSIEHAYAAAASVAHPVSCGCVSSCGLSCIDESSQARDEAHLQNQHQAACTSILCQHGYRMQRSFIPSLAALPLLLCSLVVSMPLRSKRLRPLLPFALSALLHLRPSINSTAPPPATAAAGMSGYPPRDFVLNYNENERTLCYHGPLIYEAVSRAQRRAEEAAGRGSLTRRLTPLAPGLCDLILPPLSSLSSYRK